MAEAHQRNRSACSQNRIVGCVCGAQTGDFLLLKEAEAFAVRALKTTVWVVWGGGRWASFWWREQSKVMAVRAIQRALCVVFGCKCVSLLLKASDVIVVCDLKTALWVMWGCRFAIFG